ncbi:MAG: M1 family metallopeptidase [Chitinophagales bacterium]|nr:M1 family metallopeptidase [Chitinophagales bacterium]
MNQTFFKFITLSALFVMTLSASIAQPAFNRQDTLRGTITEERAWWDLSYYHLDINIDASNKMISGSNTITYKALKPGKRLQIDLQEPMQIERVMQGVEHLNFTQDGNVWMIDLPQVAEPGAHSSIIVYYSGKPQEARMAPWDAALSWNTDQQGNPFIATSCQGDGASMWWPCKDHMYDEPDSMLISVRVPDTLMDVSNGQLREVEKHNDGTQTFHWFVRNPINNYGVNVNIASYVHFSETYKGEKGALKCDYYVLPYNLEKAKKQFEDVPRMLEAFEHWFGPYPFYEDGYKLVEVPYLGMEHQSSVTYGNGYQNGYRGSDLSGTGWGLKFDFIIIHESGHEWFANNITYKDIADMWIHEGFTAYSENLYLDYHYGKEASAKYVIGTRSKIMNDRPVIGNYNVNHAGSVDMYYKGANMLHTLRQLVNDDEKWRSILRGLNSTFYHQTVTTQQIEDYLIKESGLDLSTFFDQYLRTIDIPVLEYQVEKKKLSYRWANCVKGFNMPVQITLNGTSQWIEPIEGQWTKLKLDNELSELIVDEDFYVRKREILR